MGDFDAKEARAQIEQLFSSLPTGSPIQRVSCPVQQAGEQHIELDKQQAVLALALPAPSLMASAKQTTQLLVLLDWCRDMAGPIFSEIREKRGLAYYASAANLPGIDAGCLYFYLGTSAEQLAEAREALESCLAELAQKGMSEDELERTRRSLLNARLTAMQSPSRQCSAMAIDALLGLGADYSEKLPQQLEMLTAADMACFMKETLAPSATHTWVSLSPRMAEG